MPTRRDFLKTVCGAAALALGPVLLADDAMAADGIRRKANGQVVVTVAKVPGLARVGGTVALGSVKGVPVAVVRTGRRTYRALDLRCTHEGETVGKSGRRLALPAARIEVQRGRQCTGGPAQRSLSTVRSSFVDGKLTVG